MDLCGSKNLVFHFEGNWNRKKYKGGKRVVWKDVDGDELCHMDMVKEIESFTCLKGYNIKWVNNGIMCTITNDVELMEMWANIKKEDGEYHLYLDQETGPTAPWKAVSNKGQTTPTKNLISPTVAIRKSPRLHKDSSGQAAATPNPKPSGQAVATPNPKPSGQSVATPDPKPKKPTPIKKAQGRTLGIRRSCRIQRKFQFKFSNNPSQPLELSDNEEFDADLQSDFTDQEDDPDWAFRNLIERTFEEGDSSVQKDGDQAQDNVEYGLIPFDNLHAEEEYHTSEDEDSDEDNEVEPDTEEVEAEDVNGTEGVEPEDVNSAEGVESEFKEFLHESENLFEKEDNDRFNNAHDNGKLEEIYENMEWPTMGECRSYLRKYAIWKRFEYKQKKNNNLKICLVCKDPACKWRVYVRRKPQEHTARLRSFVGQHTCKCNENQMNSMARAGWVANEVEEMIRNHKEFKPKDVQAAIWVKHGLKISYHTAYHAKMTCNERIHGCYCEGYTLAPEITRQILLNNSGSVVQWFRDPNDQSFVSLCISYKASLDGFVNGCRPVLGLDGSFLKGKYGGVILSVVGLDGNNGLFPIAICICMGECYDTWSRFLTILAPHLKLHKLPLTFISDRQKGLIETVAEVFQESTHHRFCFRHMYKNFKNDGFKGSHLENLTWGAAKAYKREEHDKWMKLIEQTHLGAKIWLYSDDKTYWARSYFDTICKCEHITNNFSESFNKMILTLRELPLVKLVEKYQMLVMTILFNRRTKGEGMDPAQLVPRVVTTIERLKRNYNKYTTSGATDFLHVATNRHGQNWTVDLKAHTCSCCEWQISGIPCEHAIAVIMPRRDDWVQYCSPFFTGSAYRATYASYVYPMEDPSYWPQAQHIVKPPPLNRPPGRPRVKRRRDADEPNAPKRQQKMCSKCGKLGHNKATCKGAPARDVDGMRVRAITAAEGPSMQQGVCEVGQRPSLLIPAMTVPSARNNSSVGNRKRHSIYEPTKSSQASASSQPSTPCTPAVGESSSACSHAPTQ